ncbi:MAG: hypothetical protein ACI93R_004126 [Flavobacteriales bacterium]|jgi:hypothetical protein
MTLIKRLLCISALFFNATCFAENSILYYAVDNTGEYTEVNRYFLDLLRLAASKSSKSSKSISIEPVLLPEIREIRTVKLIQKGDISIAWFSTTKEREAELRPIRIPLYKGLIGWRVFLIHQDNKKRFNAELSNAELKAMTAIQGHDWPDTSILRANGYSVYSPATWSGLFKMLEKKRGLYFPRSVLEAPREVLDRGEKHLALEESILLRYPSAYYFFMSRNDEALAAEIEHGLRLAIDDGSFDELFYRYFAGSIVGARLKGRQIFNLNNSNLPENTPLNDTKLWYQLGDYERYIERGLKE